MINWPYEKITDHEQRASGRLTSEYQRADKIKALVAIYGARAQIVEDAIWSQLTLHWVDTAEGIQLDRLGQIVQEPRLGRGDEEYRRSIQFRIKINTSGAQPDIQIEALKVFAEAPYATIREIFPAAYFLFSTSPEPPVNIFERMQQIKPVAVRLLSIINSREQESHTYQMSDITSDGYELYDGAEYELWDGNAYVLADTAIVTDAGRGFAELNSDEYELWDGATYELQDGSDYAILGEGVVGEGHISEVINADRVELADYELHDGALYELWDGATYEVGL